MSLFTRLVMQCDDVSNDPVTREPVRCLARLEFVEARYTWATMKKAQRAGWSAGFGQHKCPEHWRP